MQAKAWLSRGIRMQKEIEQLQQVKEDIFDGLTNVTQNLDAPATSGTKDPHKYDAYILKAAELDERIKRLKQIRIEIFFTIQQLKDSRYRLVLTDRYYFGYSWGQIALHMNYSESGIYKIHGKALQAIEPYIRAKKETVD